jgi:hypothetical protein
MNWRWERIHLGKNVFKSVPASLEFSSDPDSDQNKIKMDDLEVGEDSLRWECFLTSVPAPLELDTDPDSDPLAKNPDEK